MAWEGGVETQGKGMAYVLDDGEDDVLSGMLDMINGSRDVRNSTSDVIDVAVDDVVRRLDAVMRVQAPALPQGKGTL
jgi:hypothetical protein